MFKYKGWLRSRLREEWRLLLVIFTILCACISVVMFARKQIRQENEKRAIRIARYEALVEKLKSVKVEVEVIAYINKTHTFYQDSTYTIIRLKSGKTLEVDRLIGTIGDTVTISKYDLYPPTYYP